MTDEYIRRQDAVKALDGEITVTGHKNADAVLQYMKDISNKIKALPPADVVKVVRCKDCKYNATTHKCLNPDSFFLIPKDDDFCSYGEKKE